jgi:hypothetical protein
VTGQRFCNGNYSTIHLRVTLWTRIAVNGYHHQVELPLMARHHHSRAHGQLTRLALQPRNPLRPPACDTGIPVPQADLYFMRNMLVTSHIRQGRRILLFLCGNSYWHADRLAA